MKGGFCVKLVLAKYERLRSWCKDNFCNDYFEFCFSYTPVREYFREIDRFLWESRHEKARFSNRYNGPTVIDITEWSDATPNDYFDAFMYFTKDLAAENNVVLVSERACDVEVLSRLKRFFELEISNLLEQKKDRQQRRIGFAVQKEEYEHV